MPRIEIGEWIEDVIVWLRDNADPVFDLIVTLLDKPIDWLDQALLAPPAFVIALIAGLIGFAVRGWQFAVFAVAGFLLIDGMDQWEPAMETLSLVLIATLIAVAISVPVGIAAARNGVVAAVVRPVLDFMQTLPVFVYLLPAVFFFGIGPVPGIIATIIFSIPPGVRLTQLGIRQVDQEMIEASRAFGATSNQLLWQVQLPLALPTIMAGINQVIMLSLAMVVVAGLIGAGGLGAEVIRGIQRVDVALGFEGGIGVVVLAIFLDRITEAVGSRASRSLGIAA
jgi:ABC-type proline/glycine betaine transport system permease subunit